MRFLYFLLLLSLVVIVADAQPAGPNNSTNIVDGGGGQISETWLNPNLARTQNDLYATVVTATKNKRTDYIQAQNFGFNIPAGSSINGIVVEVDRFATATSGGSVADSRIRIIDATGTIGSTDQSTGLTWPTTDADTYQSYGGVTDTWGITDWTSAKINNDNFGVVIMAETSNTNSATFNLFVDEIRITVYYTTGAGKRYAVASGSWSNTSSWSATPGGASGASVPTTANDVFIGGGFTITQNVNGASCNSLTIGTTETTPTGNLTFDNNNRDVSIGAGGLVITANGNVLSTFTPTLTVAGDFTLNSILTNRDFTVRINGSNADIINGTGTMGILSVQTYCTHTGTIKVTGKITGPALRLINSATAYLTYSGTTANMDTDVLNLTTIGNTVEFSQTTTDATDFNFQKPSNNFYNLVISGNAPKHYNGNVTINGNLTITSTGILSNLDQSGITLYGNWTNNNGAAGFVQNSCNACTVNFQGGNAQTITNAAGEQFHRIEVNKTVGTVVSAANNIIIDNRLLMTAGNFDVGSNSLTGVAATVFDGGELLIGTTGTTVPALTGTYTLNSGTITFHGAGAQTIRSSASVPAIASYVNVQFLGSGTKSLSGAIAVSRDLTIGGTATLDVTASNFGITLTGNWASTSAFLPQAGTVTLNGAASQTITKATGETFNNLIVNNSTASSAIVLGGPVTVNGTMTFTDGHVITSASNVLTLGASATVSSVADGSHVEGPVAKIKNAATIFAFPIGDGSNYMPASITPTSASNTTYVAEYFSIEQSQGTALAAGVDHISSQDYWTIQRSSGTADAAVTLVWEYASAADSEINSMAQLVVAQWSGTQWTSRGNAGTGGTTTAGTVLSNTITSFVQPYFVIGSSTTNNPLSNNRYFVTSTGNWNGAVWAYRSGGAATATEPTATKNVFIEAGNTATILDAPAAQATKSMLSLTVFGTITLSNSAGQDITVNIGSGGMILQSAANVTGSDVGDRIAMSGNITLNNSTNLSHTVLETNFVTQGNTITGTGGKLPILNVNQNNQTFTGSTLFTTLTIGNTASNIGTITVTGALSGGGTLTNGAAGTFIWQGTSAAGRVINATTAGNSIQLVNNTGGNIDLDVFVTGSTFGNLTLSGANSFIQGSNIDINGNLTILSGGVFNNSNGNHKLNIGGNWINNNGAAGFVNGSNDITFDGSSAQSISISSGTEIFASLVINNTSLTGVTLALGEVHVSANLTLTDGIVFTDATNLLVLEDNATSDVGSAITFVDGPMKKIGNEAFVFPVGDGITWARLGIESITNFDLTTEFTCQYFHSSYSNTTALDVSLHNVSTIEHWILNRVTDPGNNASGLVRLFWQSDTRSAIEDLPDLRVGHYYTGGSGLKWYSFGGTTTDNGNGSGSIVSTTTFTSFNAITFGSGFGFNPLPVELISFTAHLGEDESVVLNWRTASEKNNDYFTVERSGINLNFETLFDVQGGGNTNAARDYVAIDEQPYGGTSYYRLRQTDFDGAKTYSNVVAITRPKNQWSIYPNPSDGIRIQLQGPESSAFKPVLITIMDMRGIGLFTNACTSNSHGFVELILKNQLISGVYTLIIHDEFSRHVKRLVVSEYSRQP